MKTPPTTFRSHLIEALQDVVRAQWSALGFPFAAGHQGSLEVIDPEALIWASLKLADSDARLLEAAANWVNGNQHLLVRQRINHRVKTDLAASEVWQGISGSLKGNGAKIPPRRDKSERVDPNVAALSKANTAPSIRIDHSLANLLLRARCLLGSDLRHFILVYLLARPQGGKLSEVKAWLSYSYKSVLEAADRWEAIRAIENQRGYVRLCDPQPWIRLLGYSNPDLPSIAVVNWFEVFSLFLDLNSAVENAEAKGLPPDGPLVQALRRDALERFDRTILAERQLAIGWQQLRRALTNGLTSP
jgi:hypothetical protein